MADKKSGYKGAVIISEETWLRIRRKLARIIQASLILSCATTLYALDSGELQRMVMEMISENSLEHGQWSVYARYCDSDELLVDLNGTMSLAPASGLKMLSTGTALLILGADFRFDTGIYLNGQIRNGRLKGDLTVRGSGDPVLASHWLPDNTGADEFYREIISALKARGIEQIDANVVIDNSLYDDRRIPDHWIWQDIGNYYGAGMQAFCFGSNLYHLYFQPGKREGDPVKILRTEPPLHGMRFINHLSTGAEGSGDNAYIYSAPGMDHAVVRGTVPAGPEEFDIKGAVANPPLNTAEELKHMLLEAGIRVSGEAQVISDRQQSPDYNAADKLHSFTSPDLKRIISVTNRRSVNLFTEQMLLAANYYGYGRHDHGSAVELVSAILDSLEVDRGGFKLYDGSGLSRSNRVTTKIFSDFLAAMSRREEFQPFYDSFSIAGNSSADGHISRFCRQGPAKMNARVKSGYIEGVRSHSGYVTAKNGRLIAFSCIANNYSGKTSGINKLHERVCSLLADLD